MHSLRTHSTPCIEFLDNVELVLLTSKNPDANTDYNNVMRFMTWQVGSSVFVGDCTFLGVLCVAFLYTCFKYSFSLIHMVQCIFRKYCMCRVIICRATNDVSLKFTI